MRVLGFQDFRVLRGSGLLCCSCSRAVASMQWPPFPSVKPPLLLTADRVGNKHDGGVGSSLHTLSPCRFTGTQPDEGSGQADTAAAGGGGQQQRQQEAGQQEADEGDQLAQLVRSAAAASESPTVLALVPPELRCVPVRKGTGILQLAVSCFLLSTCDIGVYLNESLCMNIRGHIQRHSRPDMCDYGKEIMQIHL